MARNLRDPYPTQAGSVWWPTTHRLPCGTPPLKFLHYTLPDGNLTTLHKMLVITRTLRNLLIDSYAKV